MTGDGGTGPADGAQVPSGDAGLDGSAAARDLARVVASLSARLVDQVEGMLADPRFDAGRAALDRLRDPAHAEALGRLDPREAVWLADELRHRWAAVGDVVLDPVAWIEPAGVGVGVSDSDTADSGPAVGGTGVADGPRLVVRVDGLEPGWTVAWTGATADPTDPAGAVPSGELTPSGDPSPSGAAVPSGDPAPPDAAPVTARVMGRGPSGRVILVATWAAPTTDARRRT